MPSGDLLHAKLLRSPHPHARVVAIDRAAALAVPGVLAILAHEDAPDVLFSTGRHEIEGDDPFDTRVFDRVRRFQGQRVALVVARVGPRQLQPSTEPGSARISGRARGRRSRCSRPAGGGVWGGVGPDENQTKKRSETPRQQAEAAKDASTHD